MQGYKQTMRPASEFLALMGIWLACFAAGNILALVIWIAMTGQSIEEMAKGMLDAKNVSAMKVMQSVSSILIFFVPAYITARIVSHKPFERLGFKGGLKIDRILIAIFLMLSVLPFVAWLGDVNKAIPVGAELRKIFDNFESQFENQVKQLAQFSSPLDYISALLVIALLPALVEEAFFRGGMQKVLHRWFVNPHVAILATSIIFSLIHFSFYGFLPRIALGMMLGYIFYFTGNIWYSVLGHFVNNGLMVTILYVQYLKDKTIDTKVGESAPWWAAIISIILVVFLFLQLRRRAGTKVSFDSIADTPAERSDNTSI